MDDTELPLSLWCALTSVHAASLIEKGKEALCLTFRRAPATIWYSQFLGSVWTSMRVWQQGERHGEGPDLGGVVVPDLLLLGIEAHALANQVLAAVAPHIERHLKADDQDALIELLGSLPQRVLALLLQHKVPLSLAVAWEGSFACRQNFNLIMLRCTARVS